jgi:hypothetical protein
MNPLAATETHLCKNGRLLACHKSAVVVPCDASRANISLCGGMARSISQRVGLGLGPMIQELIWMRNGVDIAY